MKNFYSQFLSNETFYRAWQLIKKKNTSGGIDALSVELYEKNLTQNLYSLVNRVRQLKWIPQPYLQITIPKKDNDIRRIGLMSLEDKIVQQAIRLAIEPELEAIFKSNSYGYRPEKGPQKAVRRVFHEINQKTARFIIKFDIDNFFDDIDHTILFSQLNTYVKDDNIINLIKLSLQMGTVDKHLRWKDRVIGIPQGAILSPLLSNLYLHAFDTRISALYPAYVRYADDFVILCNDGQAARNIIVETQKYLNEQLKLSLNTPFAASVEEGVEFLGILIQKQKLGLSTDKLNSLYDKIKHIEFSGDRLAENYISSLRGIKQYYMTLLPSSYANLFDEVLMQTLSECPKLNTLPQKKVRSIISDIEFFSAEYLANRRSLCEILKTKRSLSVAKNTQKLIHSRKLEYHRRENENSELVVSSYGYFIGINAQSIILKKNGERQPVPPTGNLKHIVIMSDGVTLSSNAISFCVEHDIPIDFFNSRFEYTASILSPKYMHTSLWIPQNAMTQAERICIAKKIIMGKLKNQLNLIKYFHKYHHTVTAFQNRYEEIVEKLDAAIQKVKNYTPLASDNYREQLMSIEANGATLYWDYIRLLIADDGISFTLRNKHGATDPVNSMLNYGYALLYPRVWQNVIRMRLNPYEGFIHYQENNPNLVFDIIELFRAQAVDRVVITMIQKGLSVTMENGLLDNETKKLLVKNIIERLHRYEHYRGKEIQFYEIIHEQTREIAAYVSERKNYRPYIAKW